MVVGLLRSPDIIKFHLDVDGHCDAVEERHFVGRAEWAALGAGAVVAVDIDDERVVQLANILDGLDDTSDLVVIVSRIGGKDLHLFDVEFLLLGGAGVPVLDDIRGPGFEPSVGRDDSQALLVLADALAQLVPAVVE